MWKPGRMLGVFLHHFPPYLGAELGRLTSKLSGSCVCPLLPPVLGFRHSQPCLCLGKQVICKSRFSCFQSYCPYPLGPAPQPLRTLFYSMPVSTPPKATATVSLQLLVVQFHLSPQFTDSLSGASWAHTRSHQLLTHHPIKCSGATFGDTMPHNLNKLGNFSNSLTLLFSRKVQALASGGPCAHHPASEHQQHLPVLFLLFPPTHFFPEDFKANLCHPFTLPVNISRCISDR